jgi:hypothetical protein
MDPAKRRKLHQEGVDEDLQASGTDHPAGGEWSLHCNKNYCLLGPYYYYI